ncbi:MAG: hypothetical protein SFX73_19750 [Kofleriaceae bacterium]|nr:hypothetical protein [Kofleriaceae bacterium]
MDSAQGSGFGAREATFPHAGAPEGSVRGRGVGDGGDSVGAGAGGSGRATACAATPGEEGGADAP